MNLREKYEWIERYLEGSLHGEELSQFEAKLAQEPAFAEEVEQHKFFLETLDQFAQREQLKAQMNVFHKDLEKHKAWVFYKHPIIQNFWKKHFPTMAIAASVAIFTALGILWNVRNWNNLENQQISYFQSLKKDLDAVKKRQTSLEEQAEKMQEQQIDHTATAFAISVNGYLLTNYHAVKDATTIFAEAKQDSLQRYQVKIFFKDEQKDLAILQIVDDNFKGFKNLPYAFRYENADLGEEVFTLAYPREDLVYGKGEIASRTGFEGDSLEYQVSIPVNPGNSGGPLLDEKGNLIGIINRKHTKQEGAAFAIKAKYIKALVDSIELHQKPEKPIIIPQQNLIFNLKRPQQIKALQNFVFELKVYNSQNTNDKKS
jgi:cytochrome oxidase Cu insertion factor (SCO1/SenC/PrrC family)